MKRRPHTAQCANVRLPNDLTQALVDKILSLQTSVKTDYLKSEIMSKFVSSETDPAVLRRQRAIDKWLATEARNEVTNDRLITANDEDFILPHRMSFGRFVSKCREVIAEIIGETVPFEGFLSGLSFSGGASTSRKRTSSSPGEKYLGKAHVTAQAKEVWDELVHPEFPIWTEGGHLEIEVVPGNMMFTVPKKTDIDRVACKEPDINMYLQKGAGALIRYRLKHRARIDLNDQSINSSLARVCSIDGSLATLDLSSASDSVSTGLVELLLPDLWFSFLNSLRSQVTFIGNYSPFGVVEHRNHMFSSMGNGFTFELESLLFYALARTTAFMTGTRGVVSVYGDDLIIPSGMFHDFVGVLSYFGFLVNDEKSWSEGPFRESCGGHFYNGYDITPFYIKEPITHLIDLIHVANQLREWATRGTTMSILDPEVEEIWVWLRDMVPRCLWGGADFSYKFQLVSYNAPERRLVEETKKRDLGLGGYLHWLNATWDRNFLSDGISTSGKTIGKGRFRLKKVRHTAVPQLSSIFLSELR